MVVKPEAKCRFRAAAMLLYYVVQKITIAKVVYFFEDILPHKVSRPCIRDVIIASTSISLRRHNGIIEDTKLKSIKVV
jgi:hypothetical protein